MQKTAFTLGISIVLTSIMITLFVPPPFSLITWIDVLFALSLLVTIVGASLYIIEKGFFDPFIKNFRYFLITINKGKQMADEVEQKQRNSHEIQPRKYRITGPCLTAGGILLFLAICFSIIQ